MWLVDEKSTCPWNHSYSNGYFLSLKAKLTFYCISTGLENRKSWSYYFLQPHDLKSGNFSNHNCVVCNMLTQEAAGQRGGGTISIVSTHFFMLWGHQTSFLVQCKKNHILRELLRSKKRTYITKSCNGAKAAQSWLNHWVCVLWNCFYSYLLCYPKTFRYQVTCRHSNSPVHFYFHIVFPIMYRMLIT